MYNYACHKLLWECFTIAYIYICLLKYPFQIQTFNYKEQIINTGHKHVLDWMKTWNQIAFIGSGDKHPHKLWKLIIEN